MVMATTGESRVGHAYEGRDGINISRPERLVSVMLGAALGVYALRRRNPGSLPLALIAAELARRGATGHCYVYDALGVSTANAQTPNPPARLPGEIVSDAATVDARKAIKMEETITIDRMPAYLYAVWRDFEQLPRYLPDLESVTTLGAGRSHWVAKTPGDKRIEWDSEIVNDIPNQLIAWKTIGEPDVSHAGSVHFRAAPSGRGTEMRIVIDYEPPGGRLGALVAGFTRVFGQAPELKLAEDLRRFKTQVEAGAVSS